MTLAYDIGCYAGSDTRYMLSRGYGVVAIEANPTQVDWLAQDLYQNIKDGEVVLISAALLPETYQDPTVQLYIEPNHPEWTSVNREWKTKIVVPVIHISQIIEKFGMPELIKMDIEGSEFEIIRNMIEYPEYLIAELSNLKTPSMLYDRGYRKFRLSDQNKRGTWNTNFFHGEHGSGPFMDELIIPWVGIKEIERQLTKINKETFWCDLHATTKV